MHSFNSRYFLFVFVGWHSWICLLECVVNNLVSDFKKTCFNSVFPIFFYQLTQTSQFPDVCTGMCLPFLFKFGMIKYLVADSKRSNRAKNLIIVFDRAYFHLSRLFCRPFQCAHHSLTDFDARLLFCIHLSFFVP